MDISKTLSKTNMKHLAQVTLILLVCCLSNLAFSAEKKVDGYIVHYNAFASDFLSPDIANAYGITRSRNVALLNITVLREDESGTRTSVDASIKATATNLSTDAGAIYHIAEFKIINQETINFSIIAHDQEKQITSIEFTQQFFK